MADWHVEMDSSLTDEATCGVERQQKALSRETEEFNERLAEFPHSFQLKNCDALTPAALRSIKNHLEAALGANLSKTTMEIAAMHNLLAFVLSSLGEHKKAKEELDKARSLQGQGDNIVSLANSAVVLWQMKRKREANLVVQQLLDLKQKPSFCDLVVKAKAEMGSSYLRFGRKYIKYAVTKFEEVIPLASEPEKSLWMFDLAVAYRQSIDLQSLPYLQDQTETTVREKALKLLFEVVHTAQSENLKANAYAEIGLLIHVGAWDEETERKLCSMVNLSSIQSIKRALQLDGNDPTVMQKVGRLFRYKRDLQSSLQNLKKAVERQKSSCAYHHLGLTFKAMATNNARGRPAVKRGGKRYQRKKRSMAMKAEANRRQNETGDSAPHSGQPMAIASAADDNEQEGIPEREETTGSPEYDISLDSGFSSVGASSWPEEQPRDEPMDWQDEEEENHVQNDLVIDKDKLRKTDTCRGDGTGATPNAKTLRKLMKAIKSPPSKTMTRLDKNNPKVVEAINNFEAAIDFSEKENTRAMYDLGLLYKACGMNDEALQRFRHIYENENSSSGPLDVIAAYEQSGFILIEQSEKADDETKKQEKLEDAENMLNLALSASTRYYRRLPLVGNDIHRVWRSLACLLKLVEENDDKDLAQKLKDKLNILKMAKNPDKTLPLVLELEPLAIEMQDNEGLELCVDSYVTMENYEAAISTMELMSKYPHVKKFQEIYIEAAKQKLLQSREIPHTVAKKHFADAFHITVLSDASSTDGTSSDEEEPDDYWDVMLLHDEDEDAESAASKLADVLRKVCGLNVTTMEEDARPGRFTHNEMVRNIRRSKVSVVVLGSEQRVSKPFKDYLSFAATRLRACVLKLHDICHIPKSLKPVVAGGRVSKFPTCLMDVGLSPVKAFTQETASAVTELFRFIISSS